jgi:hypothetical protein
MLSDREMRGILASAFSRRFGRAGTRCELQCLQAVAWLETSYGSGWKPPGADSKNLGACQAGASWKGRTFVYVDTHPKADGTNVPYSVAFRFYDTWDQAADDLVKIVYVNASRSVALAAAGVEDTAAFSKALHDTGYYEGFGATVGERVSHHHDAVVSAIRRQAKALGEPLPHDVATAPEVPPTLKLGAKGAWVRTLQERLRAAGHDDLTVDGGFGPRTLAAVRAYQIDAGLLPDGVVGPKTWLALGAP